MSGRDTARGAYNERVRRYFWDAAHAGDPPPGCGTARSAEAAEGGAGARILLTAVTDNGVLVALRYRVFGCPHLIAATEAVCERFEGAPVQTLADMNVLQLVRSLEIPVEKTGRILLLEDAVRSLYAKLKPTTNEGN